MKYHYEKTEYGKPMYGRMVEIKDDIHTFGTLFEKDGKGVILVQKRFVCKCLYWDRIDYWLANDIYEHPKFTAWFEQHATEENYPIFPVRSVMWALRMKPLPKQKWEDAF